MDTGISIGLALITDSRVRNSSLISYKISDPFAKDMGWDFMDGASWEIVSDKDCVISVAVLWLHHEKKIANILKQDQQCC